MGAEDYAAAKYPASRGDRVSTATLNLRVLQKRMLRETEAAHHCGLSAKEFRRDCPIKRIKFPGGAELYDVRDLDNWIDTVKAGAGSADDEILGRL